MTNGLVGIFKKLGKLGDLRTQNKENLVSSINEVVDKTKVIDTIKEKVDTSVKSVEAGLNYNTIKITKNDGTVENVLIKIQGGGSESSINVFKSSQNGGSFVAKEVTNTFTIEGLDSTKDVELIYNNLFLINGADYTLDKSTGVVGLAFDMDVDEIIYYIITNTSYDYNDLNNLPDLSQKADKSYVDRLSYVSGIEHFSSNNVNDWNVTGVYGTNEETINRPPNASWGVVSVQGIGENLLQFYTPMNNNGQDNNRRGFFWARSKDNVAWSDWKEIATTDNALVTKGILENTDLATHYENGIYLVRTDSGCTNLPINATGVYEVKNVFNHIEKTFSPIGQNKRFISYNNGIGDFGTFSGWKEVAITDNTDALDTKIGELNNEVVKKGVSNTITKGLVVNYWGSFMGDVGGRALFSANLYRDDANNYRFVNSHANATGACFTTTIFEKKPKFVVANGNSAMEGEVASVTEYELATASKINNLSLLNGWVKAFGDMSSYVSKVGNVVTVNIAIKGGSLAENTVIFNVPQEYRPNSNIVIGGAKKWGTDNITRFITVNMDGDIKLRSGFENTTYVLDFSYSIN